MQERLASKEDVFLILSEEDKQRQGASLEGWIQLTRREAPPEVFPVMVRSVDQGRWPVQSR